MRPLFASDLAGQKRKLIDTLVSLLDQAKEPSFRASVVALSHRHVGYGAKPEHYGPVGQALIFALEQLGGERFTTEVRMAWTALYLELAATMTNATEEQVA